MNSPYCLLRSGMCGDETHVQNSRDKEKLMYKLPSILSNAVHSRCLTLNSSKEFSIDGIHCFVDFGG